MVCNGEAYFRGLWEAETSAVDTWNLRDQHMVQTCLRLVEYCQARRASLGRGKISIFKNYVGKILQFFGGFVLGCIKTKFCKKICV